MGKIILGFGSFQRAKAFVEKAKKLPYVTYATDYSGPSYNAQVMVCGDLTEEQEAIIKSKKI